MKRKGRRGDRETRLASRNARRPVRKTARARDGEEQRKRIVRDPEAPRRQAEWRSRPPRGAAAAEQAREEARKIIHTLTLECKCGDAVDWRWAKMIADAKKRKRKGEVRKGDGCRRCSKSAPRQDKQRDAQRKYAQKLRNGGRILVAWPEHVEDITVWERPEEAKARLIEAIEARYGV